MAVLERRVQILVDPHDYEQLEQAAKRENKSVASVIREAIAGRLAAEKEHRAAEERRLHALVELQRLLDLPPPETAAEESEHRSALVENLLASADAGRSGEDRADMRKAWEERLDARAGGGW